MDFVVINIYRFCLLFLILFSSYNLGSIVAHHIFKIKNKKTIFESIILSVTLGLVVLSYLTFFIGIAGILNENIIWVILIISFLLGLNSLKLFIKFNFKLFIYSSFRKFKNLDRVSKTLIFCILFLIILNIIGSLFVPLNIDDIKYHFAIPKRYLNDGIITFLPDIEFSNFPYPIEMLWTISIGLDSAQLAQLLNFSFGILVLCWIYILGKRASVDLQTIVFSLTLFYSISNVGNQARSGNVEMGGVLFFLAGFYCLNNFKENNNYNILVLCGALFGAFSVVKFSNPGFVILMTAWLVINIKNMNKISNKRFKVAFLFSFSAFIIASFWYLKSYFFTGNPFYPFFTSIFGGPIIDFSRLSWGNISSSSVDDSFNHIFNFPSRLFSQIWYLLSNTEKVRGHISPLYICMLPVLIKRFTFQKRIVKDMIMVSIIFYVYWIAFYPLIRVGLPMFAILSIPTSISIDYMSDFDKRIKFLLASLLIIFCLASIFNSSEKVLSKLPLLNSFNNNIEYISNMETSYLSESASAISFINDHLDRKSKILMWSNSGYFIDLDYIYALGFITTMANPKKIYDSNQVIEELKSFGITHLAMTDNYLRKKLRETILASKKINIIYQDDHMIIASINY